MQESVVLITSQDSDNHRFGTGFIIRRSSGAVYVLTCAHVVRDVGGPDQVCVSRQPATVAASDEAEGLDLAVLKVEGLWNLPVLKLQASGDKGSVVKTIGFQLYDHAHLIRPLKGQLGNVVGLQPQQAQSPIQAWDLQIVDDHPLKPGYSGSPVVDPERGCVIGVVSHREGKGEYGLAISIRALDRIWRVVDSEQLYRLLLKLGYRQQVRLFRRLIDRHAIAALLIHGAPEYGQRWLLNRLVTQYLPYSLSGKIVKVNLARRSRRSDASALWRELARRVGLTSQASPSDIAQRVYRWWQTQDVLLVLDCVNFLPEPSFQQLLNDFWLPLASQARQAMQEETPYKLLLFLVDYEGQVAEWDAPFVEKLDASWKPQLPVRSPRLEEFSDDELMSWIEDEWDELPSDFKQVDAIVQEILENSEDGIPELVLQEICDRCGCDWYEELERKLKL